MLSKKYVPIKLNGFVFAYAFFAVICVVVDYFKLIEYYTVRENNLFHLKLAIANQIYLVLTIFVLIGLLVTLVSLVPKKYKELLGFMDFPKIEKIDWVIIIFLILITFLRLPFPDRSFDVVNYHLLSQEFGFENNIAYNFFPGNIQTFTFPLGDRMFYVLRLLLGYRGGVLLNTLVLILLFFQVKDLIMVNENTKVAYKHKGILLGVAALFALSTEFILANIGIYMIDLLALPFMLELYKLAIRNKTVPQYALIYSSLMVGLSLSIKFTSVIFCVILLGIIFIRYYKDISFKVIIASLLVLVLPLAAYVTYNFTQTNNPIFPLFNSYFESSFEASSNFLVTNVGPRSTYEKLVWPIYIFFQPQRTVELPYYSGRLSMGFLVSIAYIGIGFLRRKSDHVIQGVLMVSLIYLWTLTSGAVRYALFIEIISGIFIVNFFFVLLSMDIKIFDLKARILQRVIPSYGNQRYRSGGMRYGLVSVLYNLDIKSFFVRGAIGLLLFATLAQSAYAYYFGPIKNIIDWSQRPSIQGNTYAYFQNMKLIGSDYVPMQYNSDDNLKGIITEIDVWIVAPGDVTTGYNALLKTDIPILNLNMERRTPETEESFLRLAKSLDLQSKNIYMISRRSPSEIEASLNNYGFYILSVYEIHPTFTYFPVNLIKVGLK